MTGGIPDEIGSSGHARTSYALRGLRDLCRGNCSVSGFGIDPRNLNEIADAVFSLKWQDWPREDLIHRGLKRVEQFTWDHSAVIVRDIYREYFGVFPLAPAA